MNHLNVWRFALAAAVTFAALSAICALAVAVSPDATIAAFNNWFHGLDLNRIVPQGGKPVTLGQGVSGVLWAFVVAFVAGAILAGCYNFLAGRSQLQK